MKKILAICLVIALAATAIIGGTLAFFTDDEEATNTFTVGKVDIELTEPHWPGNDSNDVKNLSAGATVPKDPTVENIGNNPCYVRVKITGLDQFGEDDLITLNNVNAKWTKGSEEDEVVYYYNEVLAVGATTPAVFESFTLPTSLTNGQTTQAITVKAEAIQSNNFQNATAAWAAFDAQTAAENP